MVYQRVSHLVVGLFSCLIVTLAFAWDPPASPPPSSSQSVFATPEKVQPENTQTRLQKLSQAPTTKAKALYVQAEIQASQGLVERGRISFIAAEQLAPGLPFAKPEAVAKLRTQLNLSSNSSSLGGQARKPMINMSLIDALTWGCFAFVGAALMGFIMMRRNTSWLATDRSRPTAYGTFAPPKASPFRPQVPGHVAQEHATTPTSSAEDAPPSRP